ncbi:MAG: arsenic efflux protein [Planctomycetes bacterium]|nr:arsenic efflux protein [Planctomycetota bacterium]
MSEILHILLESAQNSFLQVGVFVGAMLLFFGYINYRYGGGLIKGIRKHKRLQILFGALLGVSPGCGGAIFVMPLYLRGTVSYGTVVATLISTMGDSSFVIISQMPSRALYVHLISLVVGIGAGYTIDALGIGTKLISERETSGEKSHEMEATAEKSNDRRPRDRIDEILHSDGREVPGTLGYEITHRGYWIWWTICGIGFVLGLILLGQQDIAELTGINWNWPIGVLGTGMSVIWMFAGRHSVADDTYAESEEKVESLKEMLIHNAHETSFVTFWVFIAYSAYSLFMHFVPVDLENLVDQAGFLPVIVTACVGLIPGCGPQILVVTLYTKGIIPFSALVAHTLSQDGDALFPIIAMNPRAALWLTVTTTIPALIVGMLFYLAGF